MPVDFYELLDVDEDATQEEVHAAYRSLAREYHPDVNPDERARDQFQAVKQAHDVLSDPDERSRYDRLGHATYVHERLDGLAGVETPPPPSTDSAASPSEGTAENASSTGRRGEPAAARRARDVATRRGTRLARVRWYLLAGVACYLVGAAWLVAAGRPETTALLAALQTSPVAASQTAFPAVGVVGTGRVATASDLVYPLAAVVAAATAGVVVREFERFSAWAAFAGTLAPLVVLAVAVAGTALPSGVVLFAVAAPLVGGVALLVAVERSRRTVSGR